MRCTQLALQWVDVCVYLRV